MQVQSYSQPVSVCMPSDEWLCNKLKKLTLMEGYPSSSSEARGLLKDQFIRPPKLQVKWYRLFSDQQKTDPAAVSLWNSDASRLNSSYSWIAKAASYLCLCHQYQTSWPGQWTPSACLGRIWIHRPSHW